MEIRLRVLEGRRTRLQERLDRVQNQLAMTQKEVDRYAAELQRHGVESVEREVRWLSDLINAERTGSEPSAAIPASHRLARRNGECEGQDVTRAHVTRAEATRKETRWVRYE